MSFIAGAGRTNIDLIFKGMPRVPCEGEEIYAKDFSIQMGGGIPATLMTLSRLGVPVKLATELGQDMFSNFASRIYDENRLSPLNLYNPARFPVNVTSVVLTEQDRTFFSYGCDEPFSETEKSRFYEMAKGAKIVLMENDYLDVYQQLKQDGATLVFDTGWDDQMTLENYKPYLELTDYYMPNQREALKITGASTPTEAAEILSAFFQRTIIKLDKEGCLGMENGKSFLVKNINRFEHVDSTGAGDAFLAGFVYGLYHDKTFKECILYGNLTGGKCVTGVGCLTEYLTEGELLRLAEENKDLIK